ncbi:MAG: LysM peptidoglycan-binding domain-containing protein [Marinobacter sp.]|nr:LysM peptidoglycan-binding domain-containing protein [Marinobacter sp.]
MSQLVNTPDYSQHYDTLLYRVKPGDTLHGILKRYHRGISEQALIPLVQQVQADNPKITNPDFILPDQLIKLIIPQQYCSAPTPCHRLETIRSEDTQWVDELEEIWTHSTREERGLFASLLPAVIGLGTAKMSLVDTTFSKNTPILQELLLNFEQYKSGQKTNGQYGYHRRKLLNQLANNLGPTNAILNGRQQPNEVLRISRKKGTTPTANIEAQLKKMQNTARVAKGGGILLTGVSLSVACHQIANATTQREKNDILVEAGGGLIGGAIFSIGASLALLMVPTPIGWVGGLVVAVGSALSGFAIGKASVAFYDHRGAKIDWADRTGIERICSRPVSVDHNRLLSSAALSIL